MAQSCCNPFDIPGRIVVAERISDLLQHGCVRGLHKSLLAQRFAEQRTTFSSLSLILPVQKLNAIPGHWNFCRFLLSSLL